MNAVIVSLSNKHKVLQKSMQAIYSGKKGGQKGPFIYSEVILKALENLKKNKWQLQQSPPTTLVAPYKDIADVYNRIKNSIDKAVINEVHERKIWQSRIATYITPNESSIDIIAAIKRTRTAMSKVPIPGWDINDFDDLLDKFRKARLELLLKNNTFDEEIKGNEVLPKLASAHKDKMDAVDVFIGKVQNLLKIGEQGLVNRKAEYSATINPLANAQVRIETAFVTLRTLLGELQ